MHLGVNGISISALLGQADELSPLTLWHDPYLRHVTGFSFYQAFLSTLLSVVPAIPVAYALSRRQFIGRALLLRIFAMTLVLPVLVAVFGLLSIYGKSGLINQWFAAIGVDVQLNIYGLSGILLAHIFFKPPPCRTFITAKFRRDPSRATSARRTFRYYWVGQISLSSMASITAAITARDRLNLYAVFH